MTDPRLRSVCRNIDQLCQQHNVDYNIVIDESNLQGIMLFKRDRDFISSLIKNLNPLLQSERVHLESRPIRGGVVLVMSLKAMTESQLNYIIAKVGKDQIPMTFPERITDAINRQPVTETKAVAAPYTGSFDDFLLMTAKKIVESQDQPIKNKPAKKPSKKPSKALWRWHARNNAVINKEFMKGQEADERAKSNQPAPPPLPDYYPLESRLSQAMSIPETKTKHAFNQRLIETLDGMAAPAGTQSAGMGGMAAPLDATSTGMGGMATAPGVQSTGMGGMATPSGAQSTDLFQRFAKALAVLGQQMGIGPLQDQLKQRGINWKKSDDSQSIILYIDNAATNAPQPIARISAETLEKPNEFEEQLLAMIDFSKGEAPGAFQQKQKELQAQEKAVREIAKQSSPQQDQIAAQMGGGQVPAMQPQAVRPKPTMPQAKPAQSNATPPTKPLQQRPSAAPARM